MKVSAIIISLFFFSHVIAQPCNMQGTYTIGPGGTYSTLASALTTLRTNGLGGPVILEIKANYSFISESNLSMGSIPCVSATNTITLRPEAGAVNIQFSSSFTNFLFGNAKYVTIDGRPGGTGTTSQLSIVCAGTSLPAISFTGNSENNTIKYVKITGANESPTSGAILFSGTGNSYNTISNCVIGGNNFGHLLNALYAESSGAKHTNNIISGCSFSGFYPQTTSVSANGILLNRNNESWMIENNSFYQDLSNWGIGNINAITINDTLSYNMIMGNFIGGTAPACGGSAFQMNGRFRGIQVACAKTNSTIISGNVIRNIDWRSMTSTGGIDGFIGIHIASGKVDCGSLVGNVIGSMTQNEAILVTSYDANLAIATGILVGYNPFHNAKTDTVFIRNNKIGGIRSNVAASNFQGGVIKGISVTEQYGGYIEITNDTIGSYTLNNSLNSRITTNGEVIGIDARVSSYGPTWPETYPISNLIANNVLSHFYGRATGIRVSGGKPQVLNNIITEMNMATTADTILSIYCIRGSGLIHGSLIKGNQLYNMNFTASSGGISGIDLHTCTGVEVAGNNIHNLQLITANPILTGIITGIEAGTSTNRIRVVNNMISLGIDLGGNPINNKNEYNGIKMLLDTSFVSHNSVYIAGTGDRSANALYFTKQNTSASRVTNNILVNQHAQETVNLSFFNCAVYFDPIFTSTLGGLTMSHNLYQVNGLGSFIGSYNNTRHLTLAAWQAAIGNDANSSTGDPNFLAPASSSSNLHIKLPTPADANGTAEASVTVDYDEQARTGLTPVDIGADAISSTPAPGILSFTPATGGTGTVVTITGDNFTGATAVSFGGVAATTFTVVNSTTVTALVGAGATGAVSVTTPGGIASLPAFIYIPPPGITSFTPTSGGYGRLITITGTNFTGATAVSFGGVAAQTFSVVNSATISAVVEFGASGNVVVTTPGGTASLGGFTFIPTPVINSFSPASGGTGTIITITGTNFTGATEVSFGGVPASSYTVVNATTITAVVGAGASGTVSVITLGGIAGISGFTFTVVTSVGGANGSNSPELRVSPNPASDLITVTHPATPKQSWLKLIDLNGREVKAFQASRNTTTTTFSVKGMASGMYKLTWTEGTRILRRSLLVTQ